MNSNILKQTIQERFFEITKGETDEQILSKTELTEKDLERIEDAATELSANKLKRISEAYNVSVDWLVGLTDVKEITK